MSDALERRLREREPAVRLVSELAMIRSLARAREAGERVPDNPWLPLWVPSEGNAPKSLLLTTPDDRLLHGYSEAEVNAIYDRLLDRAGYLEKSVNALARFNALPESERREIRFVLVAEQLLPDRATEGETATTFLAVLAELTANRPEAIADFYPLLAASKVPLDPLLDGFGILANPSVESNIPALPPVVAPNVGETIANTRNHVRLAIDYYRRPEDRAAAVGILCEGLGGRLRETLAIEDSSIAELKSAMAALLPYTAAATWTPAAKALYELQKLALDLAKPLYAVAPFEWLRSFGERPVKQPLEKARDIIRLRHLAKAEKQLAKVPLGPAERRAWDGFFHREKHDAEAGIATLIGPILRDALDRAGLVPTSRVESVAREKLVGELLRTICERGFFRLADLRDAIARNSIKMHDLDGFRELATGDELLRADKILASELFGIYQRGEAYLRGIQRLSAAGFGTPVGRAVALFVLLPFGGAFLTLEFLQHLLHGAAGLAHAIGLTSETHHPHVVVWWSVLLLGGFFLGLLHSPPFRAAVGTALGHFGRTLGAVFVTLPKYLWNSRPVRAIRQNPTAQYLWRTVALPLAIGALATLATVLYSDLLSPAAATGIGAIAFLVSLVAIHSKPGLVVYEALTEAALDTGRYVWASLIPGLLSWFVWAFREVADAVERLLYAADEWFRFREGQSREMLWLKVALAVLWFPVAYVVRFVFYLLVEPQVNPVKHFPVVTVSHKIIWPMVPQIAGWTGLSPWTVGTIVNGVPGIFGFIAWELKENWRLYAANRPERLQPVPVGHHGETVRGLLRPGFHSGTVPKLFRKLRAEREAPRTDALKLHRLEHELHHVSEAIRRQVEWELLPLLNDKAIAVGEVTVGCQRIQATLVKGDGRLSLAWELIDGEIVGSESSGNWMPTADEYAAVAGLNALAAVKTPVPPTWADWVKRWETRS